MIETVRDVAGPELAVYRSQVLVKDADDGSFRWLPIVVACRPQGGCRVIAPDGADYPDLRTFVDDTKLVNRGDSVTGNANVASPAEAVRTETFVKRPYPPWARYALVGALLLGLPLVVVLLIRSTRRRRADQQRLLRTWQPTQGPE